MAKNYLIPDELLYTSTHEWIRVLDDIGTVGITDYAQDQLHDIVYVDLPEVGKQVKKGEVVLEIESVKAVAEVYSPVSGEIIEVNESLNENPELINQSPYQKGWIFKIKILNREEVSSLLPASKYRSLLR